MTGATETHTCKIEDNSSDVLTGGTCTSNTIVAAVFEASCLSVVRDNDDTRGCFTGGGDTPRYHRAGQHPVDGNTC